MTEDSLSEPGITPEEAAYLRFLGATVRGEESSLEALCEERPDLAAGIERLDRAFREFQGEEGSSIFGPGLADRLLQKYGEALLPGEAVALPASTPDNFPYEERGEVARGGMGVIDEVWDPILRRSLAMKRVRSDGTGDSSHRWMRFLREARITAQLDHPGVVPVHELRLDPSGEPYFTMRLVRGRDLRTVFRWAREGREGWSLTRALEVLIKVCDTLAYAHSHDVIHRDLKPANVMVGEFGEVYVMDWGLAKVLRGEMDDGEAVLEGAAAEAPGELDVTLEGSVLGTPSYMAPEQATGDLAQVGPAADVYAVGAMLYLLLTGSAPYGDSSSSPASSVLEALRDGPPRPVRDQVEASPRLTAICEEAMARDLAARMPGMTALASALRGVLEAEQEAREEAERAREEARRASAVSSFMQDLFLHADPASHQGREVSAREILDRGAERLDRDLRDQPIVRADLMSTMGDIYLSLGVFDRARGLHEEAFALRRKVTGPESLEVASSLASLGVVHQAQAQFAEAERCVRERLAILRGRKADRAEIALAQNDLGVMMQCLGKFKEAEPQLLESLRVLESTEDGKNPVVGQILNNLGSLYSRDGRDRDAEPWYRRALEHNRAVLGDTHPEIAINLNNLAGSLGPLGKLDEAERCYRESLALRRRIFQSPHPKVAVSLNALGSFLTFHRGSAEGEAMLEESLAIHLEIHGEDHPAVAASCQNLADSLRQNGDLEKAEAYARRAVAIRRRVWGDEHLEVANALGCLGSILTERGALEEAGTVLDEAIAVCRSVDRLSHPFGTTALAHRARAHLFGLEFEKAKTLLKEALAVGPTVGGRRRTRALLVVVLAALGDGAAEGLGRDILAGAGGARAGIAENLGWVFDRVAGAAADRQRPDVVARLREVRDVLLPS